MREIAEQFALVESIVRELDLNARGSATALPSLVRTALGLVLPFFTYTPVPLIPMSRLEDRRTSAMSSVAVSSTDRSQ